MLNEVEKAELFSRVVTESCQDEQQTQITFNGIYDEFVLDNAKSVIGDINNNKRQTRLEQQLSELDEKKGILAIVENKLSTIDATHSQYKATVVDKNKLVASISELELKLEEKETISSYLKQITNMMLEAEAYLELELLHHIKDHATAQGWTLDDKNVKDLVGTV